MERIVVIALILCMVFVSGCGFDLFQFSFASIRSDSRSQSATNAYVYRCNNGGNQQQGQQQTIQADEVEPQPIGSDGAVITPGWRVHERITEPAR